MSILFTKQTKTQPEKNTIHSTEFDCQQLNIRKRKNLLPMAQEGA